MADRTLFPHAFGLNKPAPLWTVPALDRCLLLALIYPVGTVFVIWAVSGHVGPAEAALGLSNDFVAWQRGLAAGMVGLSMLVIWGSVDVEGNPLFALVAVVFLSMVVGTIAGPAANNVVIVVAVASATNFVSGADAVGITIIVAALMIVGAAGSMLTFTGIILVLSVSSSCLGC
jgi:hypothetical protein